MDISSLGINKGKIKQFNSKGIYTIEDLIKYLPREYFDFRNPIKIRDAKNGEHTSIIGKITEIKEGLAHIRVKVIDGYGRHMFITWFNQKFVMRMLKVGEVYNFCGKIEIDDIYFSTQMLNPMYFSKDLNKYKKIIPRYIKIQGMSDDYLLKSIDTALKIVDKTEYLDSDILDKFSLFKRKDMIKSIHQPDNMDDVEMAEKRILFDDLFYFAMELEEKHGDISNKTSLIMKKASTIQKFIDSLPFTLTDDQLNTTRDIFRSMRSGKRVNALVQGDVGSGKTIVAFILMLIAAENDYQSALMAPTNVLAKQHYEEIKEIGEKMGYKVGFLSGTSKAKEKREILKELKSGEIKMIVGTHAIISSSVEFDNLALTIVDEEHRFGVVQRELINEKTKEGVHSVTMSATPIPRSLALTVFGDGTDVYNILQMPAGRKKVITSLTNNDSEAYGFMKKEIEKGRQCYIVCPLIEESDAEVMKGVLSVEEVYKKVSDYFRGTGFKISVISGDMKAKDIEEEIDKFSKGEAHILVSTTIIEVGVNVPNSTVMVIQNAERFGLAQLHQLRGRVGRGNHQSYCMLISQKENNEKLEAMVKTTNGFKIAEADLNLRGAGDFLGTKQSGENKYIMLMLGNAKLFERVKREVGEIKKDNKRYSRYRNYIKENYKEKELDEK